MPVFCELAENYSVYMLTSPSGKKYVGITKRKPKYRWNNGNGYLKSKYLNNAILKYGWDNFRKDIVKTKLSRLNAEKLEICLISKYNTTNEECGYNLELGGNIQKEISDRTRKRMSAAAKKRMQNQETKDKISNKLTGRKISLEIVRKSADKRIGKKLTEEHKRKLSGRIKPKEEREKISQSKKGHFVSEETKQKIFNTKKNCKKVCQFDKNNNLLSVHLSINKASINTGVDISSIIKCLQNKRKSAGGYLWQV